MAKRLAEALGVTLDYLSGMYGDADTEADSHVNASTALAIG